MVECIRAADAQPRRGGSTMAAPDAGALRPPRPPARGGRARCPKRHLDWLASLPYEATWIAISIIAFTRAYDPRPAAYDEQRRTFSSPVAPALRRATTSRRMAVSRRPRPSKQAASGPILLANRTNLDVHAWRTGRPAIGVFDDDIPGGPVEIIEISASGQTDQTRSRSRLN